MIYFTDSKRSKRAGFTIVEMIVVTTVMLLCAFFVYNVLWSMYVTSTADREQLNMIHDRQSAMAIIEGDISLTSRYLSGLESGLTDPYPPTSNGGTWSYKGDSSSSRFLILRGYSTTINPLANNTQPVFIGSGANCVDDATYFNAVQHYDTIYFVKNTNLYRRRVVDTTTATCTAQYQKTSCPSAVDLGAAQNSACQADDELILKNVSLFTVNYYAQKTDTTALSVYADGADPSLVTTAIDAEITIGTSKRASGTTVSSQFTLRLSKLNQDL